jgi:outer membrane protein insertion porin family
MFKKDAYQPLPMGDGQKSNTFASKYLFQTYSVSFSEPWFGGKNQYHLVHHCLTVNNF